MTDVLNRWVLFVNDTFIADDDATATSSSPTGQTGLYLLIPSLSLCSLKGEHPTFRAAARASSLGLHFGAMKLVA